MLFDVWDLAFEELAKSSIRPAARQAEHPARARPPPVEGYVASLLARVHGRTRATLSESPAELGQRPREPKKA